MKHTVQDIQRALEAAAVAAETWKEKASSLCNDRFTCSETGFN